MKSSTLLKKLGYYGKIWAVSFTLTELVLSVMNVVYDLMAASLWRTNLELMAVCLCIVALMFFTDKITGVDEMHGHIGGVNIMIHLIDVAVPVLGLGGFAFKWFNPLSIQILTTIGILVFVYFTIYAAGLYYHYRLSKSINLKIRQRKEEKKHDQQND